ncbi:DNA endonuclease SmrA [Rahnella sp. SAP-1]|jgi:DNA-nicking Smr family endonuclease|uniref:DNA endonuclease SmrA n=1 Tax=Rouxiella aceris TaxID=2703884 RepID=A0A848MF79_9GAMM|nr:DNA endonuclease SmrA [Rouxiella aceris]NMP26797.1 DNA endonuclease SmrA [Rouxiella aceris]
MKSSSDDNDDLLFFQEMADVQKIADLNQVVYLKNRPKVPRTIAAEHAAPENILTTGLLEIIECAQPLEYKQPGVQQGVLDKLRQGKYPLQASLNLIHKPVESCRQEVFAFFLQAQAHNLRTLLIIHGRGRHDESHANIVRSYLAKWLKQLDEVQAFSVAIAKDGGAGACYVALKKSAEAKQENWERHAKHSR